MLRSRRAEDYQIGLRLFHALPVVRENAVPRDVEIATGNFHALLFPIANTHDLDLGMFERISQQVAHVHVVEIDAGDFPFLAHCL